jgi:hypothetical protein
MPAMPAPPFPFKRLEISDDAGSRTIGAPRATRTEACATLKNLEGKDAATRSLFASVEDLSPNGPVQRRRAAPAAHGR